MTLVHANSWACDVVSKVCLATNQVIMHTHVLALITLEKAILYVAVIIIQDHLLRWILTSIF